MKTRMLSPHFGVEVSGVDPSRPISESEAAELRALLDRHQLLLLHCGVLEATAQIRFVEIFAPVTASTITKPRFGAKRDQRLHSHVSNVMGKRTGTRLLFHQDGTFTPWPNRVLSLYGEDLAGDAAPTLFASASRALAKSTATQRAAWANLTAVHAHDTTVSGTDAEYARVRLLDQADGDDEVRYQRAEHPVILNHPRTQAPTLFVNEYFTSHIPQLPPEAGEQVIMDACALLYDPAGIYAHEWRLGDLVVWDNIALQHARAAINPASRRTLRRVITNDHSAEPGFVQVQWASAAVSGSFAQRGSNP